MSPKSLKERLKEGPVLLDGAMGSLLMDMGLHSGQSPEEWSMKYPERIGKAHQLYHEAGSDILQTNTFGASYYRLKECGIAEHHDLVNRRAVEICRKYSGNSLVSGDIGPSGLLIEPLGPAKPVELKDAFIRQAKVLKESNVDLFSVETMIDLQEAVLAVKAIREVSDKSIIANMTYTKTESGYFTVMGNPFSDCVKQLSDAGADIIGTNCNLDSFELIELAEEALTLTDLPLSIKPNAGQPVLEGNTVHYGQTADQFVEGMIEIYKMGIKILGGCCGSTPAYIKLLSETLKEP
ncbi:MAG: homocysteine S-methyltransferase family protein [Candidatus Marinimicrobia bacterium]|jgi:5-methyltetrahydrofolate--homocysteine methyltransferase|nr:homocysteine S-methyltransferase family protein [Candidatus Neomarinimicrobiota bacterium]MDP6611547.1 homocysteine S-methyltransferase family protein [Candidatus Neomarinimicrobiota bacterium]|tara:strand:- start:14 stop:895 length:882 start_codon:yes stop_codon:yes gene_type:complete